MMLNRKRNFRLTNIGIRSIVGTICFGVLSYQMTTLWLKFFRYPTIVQTSIARPDEIHLPSVTVCHQQTFDNDKFVNRYRTMVEELDGATREWELQKNQTAYVLQPLSGID